MIKPNELKDMLELDENELKKLSDDQVKLIMGCLNYASRVVTREVNRRESLGSA